MQIINPATETVIREITEDNQQTIHEKFELLAGGQPAWAKVPVQERIAVIQKFYDLLDEHKDELAHTLTSEMGKPLQQSFNELNGARGRIRFFTEHAAKYLAEEWITTEGATKEKIVYEPLGIIANISAWNYPFLVGVNVFIPALIGGNAVFYKPSEYATLTGLQIQELLYKAGVPANCFQTAIGRGPVGELLLQLPLDGYFFTGSYKTGKYIAEKVAGKMVPCQLELGGKDPVYIADDIENIKAVAAGTADGAFYNNGQSCCAVERIYVHENIYDAYVKEFIDEVNSWKTGSPTEDGVYITVVSRKPQLEFIYTQVKDAVDKGAKVLAGGNKRTEKGYGFEATVVVDVTHDMSIMKDESFGPVIGIMKVKDDAEALKLMQDTEYGLTAAVYSKSWERAQKILSQIDSGTGYWNCCDRVSAPVPWSGRNHSGFGATLSHIGLRAFAKPKAYHLKR